MHAGLLESRPCVLPVGATRAARPCVLANMMATSPAAQACSA
jgi:hypothetical protein